VKFRIDYKLCTLLKDEDRIDLNLLVEVAAFVINNEGLNVLVAKKEMKNLPDGEVKSHTALFNERIGAVFFYSELRFRQSWGWYGQKKIIIEPTPEFEYFWDALGTFESGFEKIWNRKVRSEHLQKIRWGAHRSLFRCWRLWKSLFVDRRSSVKVDDG